MSGRQKQQDPIKFERMREELLKWYDGNKRDLPWRRTQDPYAIWVSEIMLQQTRVAAVIEKYNAFLEKFPTVESLAEAEEQTVLALWSGLGYYRRARMLHKAAQAVMVERDGAMPRSAGELLELPGIGSYTAAAIASIAHGEAVAVVDGNVERVLSRIRGWESHDAAGEAAVRRRVGEFASELVDPRRPGDFNQAMMELGATVCTPRNPQCLMCPWARDCRTLGEHKTPKRAPMTSREMACVLAIREGKAGSRVLLEQRHASNSVMPGLWELPVRPEEDAAALEPMMTVRHSIMQVNYLVRVYAVSADQVNRVTKGGIRKWVPMKEAQQMALTGLARKILTRAGLEPSTRRDSGTLIATGRTMEVV
jgi:A/G-specific adenine glycosylase